MSRFYRSARRKLKANHSGQAAVELAFVVSILLILVCAAIDFGRAMNDMQIMSELTRQGSNLASRGDSLQTAVSALEAGTSGLNLAASGAIYISSVTNCAASATPPNAPIYEITGQASQVGGSFSSPGSKVGTYETPSGTTCPRGNPAKLPAAYPTTQTSNPPLLPGQIIYVTEVYYQFTPITPIGVLVPQLVLPSKMYDAAYF